MSFSVLFVFVLSENIHTVLDIMIYVFCKFIDNIYKDSWIPYTPLWYSADYICPGWLSSFYYYVLRPFLYFLYQIAFGAVYYFSYYYVSS